MRSAHAAARDRAKREKRARSSYHGPMRPIGHVTHAIVETLGPLRALLAGLVIISVASAPFAGGEVVFTFPGVVSTLVAPPLAAMLMFLLLLDMLMTRLFLSDRSGVARQRLRRVLITEAILLAALVAAWAPFFSRFASR